jgi:cyclase
VRRSMWTSDGLRRATAPNSRHLTVAGAALLAAIVWWFGPRLATAAGWRYQVRELKPGVFAWLPEDIIEFEGDPQYVRAGNAGFVITQDGVLVVNATNSPFHAREVLYEIRQRTKEPVRYLVDTGSASDEMLGNQVFADVQASILATPGIQAQIRDRGQALVRHQAGNEEYQRRLRGIHITPPNQTFDSTTELSLGGQAIRVVAFAGLDAVAVDLPSVKVVFLGDLFQNQYVPRLDSVDIQRWIEALREAEALDAEVYVPGHGDPGGKKELEQFRLFLEWLTQEIQTRLGQGKTLDQTKADLVPFKNYDWHARELQDGLVEDLYRQLASRGSPAAAKPAR